MSDLLKHARSSALKFGGQPADYLRLHEFLDCSKLFLGDWRHRALLHTTFGVYLAEKWVFGHAYRRESDGEEVATRSLVEQHLIEDLNALLTPAEFLREMPVRLWMNGLTARQRERMRNLTIQDEADGRGAGHERAEDQSQP
jgi:hypothetical protein